MIGKTCTKADNSVANTLSSELVEEFGCQFFFFCKLKIIPMKYTSLRNTTYILILPVVWGDRWGKILNERNFVLRDSRFHNAVLADARAPRLITGVHNLGIYNCYCVRVVKF